MHIYVYGARMSSAPDDDDIAETNHVSVTCDTCHSTGLARDWHVSPLYRSSA